MKSHYVLLFACAGMIFGHSAQALNDQAYLYVASEQGGYGVITADPALPALAYQAAEYGVETILEHPPLPESVLAILLYPNGKEVVIEQGKQAVQYEGANRLQQSDSFQPIADTCDSDLLESAFPYVISGEDLPYQVTFDTTQASDSGDFRGSAADNISRPGGHDGFWRFTPDQTGKYIFRNFATKGESTPIPDHDFDRGFGSIGVWSGECGNLAEMAINNSITGDSVVSVLLEAGVTYTVVWEDFFVGSVENSVRLTIEFAGEPVGNTLTESISLVDEGWNFEVTGNTLPNENLEDSTCVEAEEGTGHGAGTGELTGTDIWYRLPAATPGSEYTLNVLPTSEDSTLIDTALTLHAYNLSTHQVSEIACNDDISEENRLSSITFTAEEGRIYYVMVETVPAFDQGAFGPFVLQGLADTTAIHEWQNH